MTLQEKIGLKIKDLRKENHLSQTELALKVGYKEKTAIAKIEAGKIDLPQSKLLAFSKIFGISVSYFFDETPSIQKTDITQLPLNTIAAHFDGEEYSESELEEIHKFAEFVKSRRKQ